LKSADYDLFLNTRKSAINPDKFDKLITASRTAVDNDGTLDKEATSYIHMLL